MSILLGGAAAGDWTPMLLPLVVVVAIWHLGGHTFRAMRKYIPQRERSGSA